MWKAGSEMNYLDLEINETWEVLYYTDAVLGGGGGVVKCTWGTLILSGSETSFEWNDAESSENDGQEGQAGEGFAGVLIFGSESLKYQSSKTPSKTNSGTVVITLEGKKCY